MAIKRGCGTRVKGGIYLEVGLSPFGKPVEWFIIDPPQVLPPQLIDIPRRGMMPFLDEVTGVWHMVDWIGAEYYPYPADWIEEVRVAGVSRRVQKGFPFSLITEQSLFIPVHGRAYFTNFPEYNQEEAVASRAWCPKERIHAQYPRVTVPEGHPCDGTTMCAGLWWHDLIVDERDIQWGEFVVEYLPDGTAVTEQRRPRVVRRMPGFSYQAFARPEGLESATEDCYVPAMFARFRAQRFVVVDDPEDPDAVAEAMELAARGELPVAVVEE